MKNRPAGKPGEAIPAVWCGRGMRPRVPKDIDGRLGYFSFAAETSISDDTQAFRDQGYQRVAVLDVDFHHGNGTQAIFYDRSDVLTISLHGDPVQPLNPLPTI